MSYQLQFVCRNFFVVLIVACNKPGKKRNFTLKINFADNIFPNAHRLRDSQSLQKWKSNVVWLDWLNSVLWLYHFFFGSLYLSALCTVSLCGAIGSIQIVWRSFTFFFGEFGRDWDFFLEEKRMCLFCWTALKFAVLGDSAHFVCVCVRWSFGFLGFFSGCVYET